MAVSRKYYCFDDHSLTVMIGDNRNVTFSKTLKKTNDGKAVSLFESIFQLSLLDQST